MAKQTILIVEDDSAIREGVLDALDFEGYHTLEAPTGDEGLKMGLECHYDLLLLDLVLPGKEGLEILSQIRQSRPTVPIIILTAKGSEDDRVTGLKKGADDYVVKPFSLRELLARIEALLRRTPERPLDLDTLSFPLGVIDFARQEIIFEGGEREELSTGEIDLLRYLASHQGRAISRDELLQHVWGMDPTHLETRTIDMHIARLRKKLKDKESPHPLLLTVRGKGYKLGSTGKELRS